MKARTIMILAVIICSGWLIVKENGYQHSELSYRSLSEDEIESFMSELHLKPVAFANTQNNQSTIILIKGGYYLVSKAEESEGFTYVSTFAMPEQAPIDFGRVNGDHPFLYITFLDETIRQQTNRITVKVDGEEYWSTFLQDEKGIIAFQDLKTPYEVVLYDDMGQITYTSGIVY